MTENRRPLSSRDTGWAKRAAAALAARGVEPNAISAGAVAFAGLGFVTLCLSLVSGPWLAGALFWVAALCCQLRLVCNLLDGMVAIEGDLAAGDGPLWNEAPDRLADLLLLFGAGIAAGVPWLGALAGALAIFTAYLRELGRAEGFGVDFSGPLAKPQRMAALTAGLIVAPVLGGWLWTSQGWLIVALTGIAVGTAATILRRAAHVRAAMLQLK